MVALLLCLYAVTALADPAVMQQRRDTAASWRINNPVPYAGQICLETDTYLSKFGDGFTHYNDIPYTATGPQGPQGPAGSVGPPGPQGVPGVFAGLTGDVTATGAGVSVVALVGGQTAANVAAGVAAANAATAAAVNATVVKRDASGNFSANTVTAALSGNATTATTAGNVTGTVLTNHGGTGVSGAAVFPTVGTVVTEAASETLTNKTIAGASNTLTVVAGTQLSGQTPIANGGTNAATSQAAINNLSQLTTKGDLEAFSSNTSRLPVGTDAQVLTASSAATFGMVWSTPPWTATAGAVSLTAVGQFYNPIFSATTNVDWNNGNTQIFQLTTGQTFAPTFSNPHDGAKYTLILAQPTSGSVATITLPSSVHFTAAPTFSASVNLTDIVTLVYSASSTHYYGGYSIGYTP